MPQGGMLFLDHAQKITNKMEQSLVRQKEQGEEKQPVNTVNKGHKIKGREELNYLKDDYSTVHVF